MECIIALMLLGQPYNEVAHTVKEVEVSEIRLLINHYYVSVVRYSDPKESRYSCTNITRTYFDKNYIFGQRGNLLLLTVPDRPFTRIYKTKKFSVFYYNTKEEKEFFIENRMIRKEDLEHIHFLRTVQRLAEKHLGKQ